MTKENQTQHPVSGEMTDEQIIETVREIVERDGYDVQDDHQAGLVEAVAVATVRAILSRAQDAQAIRNAALEALRDAVTEAANEWAGYVEVDTAPRVCAAHIGEAFDKAVISLKPYPAAQIGGNVLDALTSALDCWECEHLLTDAVVEKMRHALQSTPAQPVERPDDCNIELPPLPQAKHWWEPTFESNLPSSLSCWSHNAGPHPDWAVTDYFNADQMRDYALSAIAANQPQVRGKAQEPEVSSDMMNAGADAMREGMAMLNSGRSYQSVCKKIFEAMLAAAPQVAQEEGAREKPYLWFHEKSRTIHQTDMPFAFLKDCIPLYKGPQPDAQQSSEKDDARILKKYGLDAGDMVQRWLNDGGAND